MSEPLAELAMWSEWMKVVKKSLPHFAKHPIYVDQDTPTEEDFERVAKYVMQHGPIDWAGRARDEEFGARVVKTCLGRVTRMWLDSNVEIQFLQRHLGLTNRHVLDIGAGYGRLAVMMWPHVDDYVCVDAVPISTELCRTYCARFCPEAHVLTLEEFQAQKMALAIDLAINIHSWNECSLEQIERWLSVLRGMRVPWLFTVSHEQWDAEHQTAYHSWGDSRMWRDSILREFDLVAEESLGLSDNPHALWRRR